MHRVNERTGKICTHRDNYEPPSMIRREPPAVRFFFLHLVRTSVFLPYDDGHAEVRGGSGFRTYLLMLQTSEKFRLILAVPAYRPVNRVLVQARHLATVRPGHITALLSRVQPLYLRICSTSDKTSINIMIWYYILLWSQNYKIIAFRVSVCVVLPRGSVVRNDIER